MAFGLNNTLTVRFTDYLYGGLPSRNGVQIINADLFNDLFSYKIYPTNYFGIRGQYDYSGNTYYEWQYFVAGTQPFIISYKVWPNPVVGGPEGNNGRQRFVVANSVGSGWRILFVSDEYEPWDAIMEVEEFSPQEPLGASGTATITDEDDLGNQFVVDPPQSAERPPDFDPSLGWDEPSHSWRQITTGGGRYRQQLFVFDDQGDIYFGDI